jgi:hypothetical protein
MVGVIARKLVSPFARQGLTILVFLADCSACSTRASLPPPNRRAAEYYNIDILSGLPVAQQPLLLGAEVCMWGASLRRRRGAGGEGERGVRAGRGRGECEKGV